jgi:hypothetical protein
MNFKRKSSRNFGKNSENIFKIFRSKKIPRKKKKFAFLFCFFKKFVYIGK